MGLDITAHRKIKFEAMRSVEDYNAQEAEGVVAGWDYFYTWPGHINKNNPFPDQVRDSGLHAMGIYTWQDAYGFRAGSYVYYNRWRDELSRIAIGVPASDVWHNKDKYREKPFYLIVNFTDSDGIIAGPAIKTLATNFAEHREGIAESASDEFMELYDHFARAFAFALDDGCVRFH